MITDLDIQEHFVANNDGWLLHLKQTVSPAHFRSGSRPVVIVPGYGMNTFIFGFHPRGTSMERSLAERGFEVWSVNLRKQGGSRPHISNPPGPSLRAYAEVDLSSAVEAIVHRTTTGARSVDLIGCSLGGSIAYAHMVLNEDHRVGSLVTIGSPLRWEEVHPLLRAAFSSPAIAGKVKFTGSRGLARFAFPLLGKVPGLLSPYMNTAHVDMSRAAELTQTVEDPHPRVNQDIALWIRSRDMVLRGVNVTEGLRGISAPLLVVLSNRDGIVPPRATLSVMDAWGGSDRDVLHVGDEREWFAHADLFVANDAPARVFGPIADWLERRQRSGSREAGAETLVGSEGGAMEAQSDTEGEAAAELVSSGGTAGGAPPVRRRRPAGARPRRR